MSGNLWDTIIAGVILAVIGGVFGLFVHVQVLDARVQSSTLVSEDIKKELIYIRNRVDQIHEKSK